MMGIEAGLTPPAPMTGNAYDQDLPQLAADWTSAVEAFETDAVLTQIFHTDLIANMVLTKKQEIRLMAEIPKAQHWKTYLDAV